jgi:hypothetical protein
MGDLSIVFFALLIPALFIGGIVAAAVSAQRNGPTARFVRRHIRASWLLLGSLWALLAAYYFLCLATPFGRVLAWIYVVLSVCALIVGVLHRPSHPSASGESPSHPAT